MWDRFKNHLIIHNDSDLYTSYLYLLTKLNEIPLPGTDELGDIQYEFRAFFDYISSCRRRYRVVNSAWRHSTVAF